MKFQSLFSKKTKKNIINLSSAELAQRAVKVKMFLFFFIAPYKVLLSNNVVGLNLTPPITKTYFL